MTPPLENEFTLVSLGVLTWEMGVVLLALGVLWESRARVCPVPGIQDVLSRHRPAVTSEASPSARQTP